MRKQNVWRTISNKSSNGWFVWEILEYQGSKDGPDPSPKQQKNFIQCRDGSWINIHCFHSWTSERAENILNDTSFSAYSNYQIV